MHDLGGMVGDKAIVRIPKPHPLKDLLSSWPDQNSVAELFDLKWSYVNFERRIVTVSAQTAKSRKARHIPLNAEAFETLKAWRSQCDLDNGRVFESGDGARFDNVNSSWKKLLEDAKIADFRWHDMRDHFASRLAMGAVDLNTIRELLGHSDYGMTLRYAHLAPEHRR